MDIKLKKLSGFTLAEALITLVIIGVIASIVVPQISTVNFNQQGLTTKAEKVVGTIEQANTFLLLNYAVYDNFLRFKYTDNTYFSIEDSNITTKMSNLYSQQLSIIAKTINTTDEYFTGNLLNYKGVSVGTTLAKAYSGYFFANDGILFGFRFYGSCASTETNTTLPNTTEPYSVTNVCGSIFFDVNGYKKPNKLGSDQFIIPIAERGSKYSS